jgi:catechol 2,3-dioxygenase-like lactoylglutathione lyase family enzyme
MPEFPTITHLAFTVTDLDRSIPWYKSLFDAKPVLDEDAGPFRHVVWLVGGTLVGVHESPDLESSEPFNERRVGLDHLAFACANRAELVEWSITTTSGVGTFRLHATRWDSASSRKTRLADDTTRASASPICGTPARHS